mmetsp:Transcript_30099/g.70269  ORF Transcript_30099/g.70269 Transcript_30099/m.70269 type:complete len:104 (-) Transcript_30099:456-767(-)
MRTTDDDDDSRSGTTASSSLLCKDFIRTTMDCVAAMSSTAVARITTSLVDRGQGTFFFVRETNKERERERSSKEGDLFCERRYIYLSRAWAQGTSESNSGDHN